MVEGGAEHDAVPSGDGLSSGEKRARRPRRLRRLALLLLALAAATSLLWQPALAGLGQWLARSDPLPLQADALVVPSGDPAGLREAEAARLWRRGVAPVIVVSGGPIAWQTVAAQVMARHLEALGVPPGAIRVEERATSTAENALFSLPMVKELGARRVVVVTSTYHVRRARLAFRRVYEPAGIEVVVHGTPDPAFNPDRWWREPGGREYGLLELMKLCWYLLN